MIKNNLIRLILVFFTFLLYSCGSVGDALQGKKRSNQNDEFLVEKKNPLTEPPDMNELPVPLDQEEEKPEKNNDDSLDIEKALFDNNARVAGNASTARELAGAPVLLTTNTVAGSGGADATGDGSDARTDGTQAAFSQANFDTVMQSIWVAGGKPDTVYLSAFQMNVALGFTGNNNQRSAVQAGDEKVIKSLAVYVTPWGSIEFAPSRENRSRDVFIMQDNMWEVATLRGTKNVALAKTGDNTTRQVVTELTLCAKNEAANGMIADCTTS